MIVKLMKIQTYTWNILLLWLQPLGFLIDTVGESNVWKFLPKKNYFLKVIMACAESPLIKSLSLAAIFGRGHTSKRKFSKDPFQSVVWAQIAKHANSRPLLCDSKVSFSTASNTSISCVFVWIFAFFRGLNVHCVQYFHCVLFWLQHFCNTCRFYLHHSRVFQQKRIGHSCCPIRNVSMKWDNWFERSV